MNQINLWAHSLRMSRARTIEILACSKRLSAPYYGTLGAWACAHAVCRGSQ